MRSTLRPALVVAMVVALAACGSDGNDAKNSTGSSAASSAVASPTSASASTDGVSASPSASDAPSSTASESAPSASVGGKKLVIGLAVQSSARSFFTGLTNGAQEEADKLGVELKVVDGQDKSAKQDADVSDLIAAKVDGIILSPVDSTVAESLARRAIEAKVPMVAVANQIGGVKDHGPQFVFPGTVALVTNDDIDMGKKAALFVASLADPATELKIADLQGTTGAANATLRDQGFNEGLKATGVKYKIVAAQTGKFTNVDGEAVCQNFLQAHPKGSLDVIFSHSDEMSAGCARALKSANRVEDVKLVSIGGNAKGIDLLKQGLMVGTVCQKPATMGATAVKTMVEALRDGKTSAGLVFYETALVTEKSISSCDPQW